MRARVGIIHRDLKPANIKVRDEGPVKVLDFGLAKALDPAAAQSPDAMNSPTLTARATELGLIVGTAAYMAPEQARGRAVDRRADIWAFGVVLYEMLSGKRPFAGDDISITLASVLKDDVDWTVLPPDVPPAITRMLRRCLEKDPKRRLRAIGDALLELDETATTPPALVSIARRATWSRAVPWAFGVLGLSIGAIAALMWAPWRESATAVPARVSSEIGLAPATGVAPEAVISPDGQSIVFAGRETSNNSRLYFRRISQLEVTPLAGTEGGSGPFFSPDSQWIGFFADRRLKKIALAGGAAVTLCDAPNSRGAWWGRDGTIVFQPDLVPANPLQRVSERGGAPAPIKGLAPNEITPRWPEVLPGGRVVLYTGSATLANWQNATIMVGPLDGGEPKAVVRGGYHGRYVASGHILYIHDGTLFAVPFDLKRLEVTGDAVPALEDVLSSPTTGGAQFSVADTGTLVYVSGRGAGVESPMEWLDASGRLTRLFDKPKNWFFPRFSPDGTKLAVTIDAGGKTDIWINDAERGLTQFTFERGADVAPIWTPDGRRIAFASDRGKTGMNLYWQRSDGTGAVQRLSDSPNIQIPYSFHPSGKYLAFVQRPPQANVTSQDIMILPLEGDEKTGWRPGKPTVFLGESYGETMPAFSRDGRWIAYASWERGFFEIYVRPFPSGDGKWRVSTEWGLHPTWSKTRDEIYYLVPGARATLWVAPYTVDGDSFRPGRPREWSSQPITPHGVDRAYDLHPDGRRMVVSTPPLDTAARSRVVYYFNFLDELRRMAPAK